MRLLSFKRFELDLPSLLEKMKEKGIGRSKVALDFTIDENESCTKAINHQIGGLGEPILIELINPELMACTGFLKDVDESTGERVIILTVIHKNQFITMTIPVIMGKEKNFYSVKAEITAKVVVDTIEKLVMPTMGSIQEPSYHNVVSLPTVSLDFVIIAAFFRAHKNNIEIGFLNKHKLFSVDIIGASGEIVTYPLPYLYLKRMHLITETGDNSYTVNVERGVRMLKYIARASEIVSLTMLAEVSDL